MTSLVAIRCKDGVVIGSDSSATFGDGHYVRTIEQTTDRKIDIIGTTNKIIIAGTGFIGHHQRFVEAIRLANAKKGFENKSEIDVAKELARIGVNDFSQTTPPMFMEKIPYSAFVAFRAGGRPGLCELVGSLGFQPELKRADDLWFSSLGSGQPITDPFLALFRSVFWNEEAPDVRGGMFTAYWALQHACTVNPGGVNFPIKIAVYGPRAGAGSQEPWLLTDHELAETKDLVQAASDHFRGFKDVVLGKAGTFTPPPPPPSEMGQP